MTRLYAYAIGLLLLAIAVGGAWWYVRGLQLDVKSAEAKLAVAQQSANTCATALGQANDATSAAIAQAKLMQSHAQELIDGTAGQKAKNSAAGAVFSKKISDSTKAPDCQSVLEAMLCPALSGY